MSEMIASCPFCGGAGLYTSIDNNGFYIGCASAPGVDDEVCGARGPVRGSEAAAIAAWNRRPVPSLAKEDAHG